MQLYIFQSTRQPDLVGFTADRAGAGLPSDLGPWTSSRGDPLPAGSPTGTTAEVVAAVERDGFYVVRNETLSRNTGITWVGK